MTSLWLVTHDCGEGETYSTVWSSEDKATAFVIKFKADLADRMGADVNRWDAVDNEGVVMLAHPDFGDMIFMRPVGLDDGQPHWETEADGVQS